MRATEVSVPAVTPVGSSSGGGVESRSCGRTIEPLLLRASEVATALSLGRSTVYQLMASGGLPVIRIGRAIRVPRSALESWVRDQTALGADAGA